MMLFSMTITFSVGIIVNAYVTDQFPFFLAKLVSSSMPVVIGKPSSDFFMSAVKLMRVLPENVCGTYFLTTLNI